MHIPHGVMHRLVVEANEGKRTLFRWGVVDTLAHCSTDHRCRASDTPCPESDHSGCHGPTVGRADSLSAPDSSTPPPTTTPARNCPLLPECQGLAKLRPPTLSGHIQVSDAINMKRRVSLAVWNTEMLCLRPTRTHAAVPEFDHKRHVFNHSGPQHVAQWCAGMDFGIRAPTVVLWAALDHNNALWIMDERYVADVVLDDHIAAIRSGLAREGIPPWPHPDFIAPDPAGWGTNEQTGVSSNSLLAKSGFRLITSRASIQYGLTFVRARLAPASDDPPRLFIHERCPKLIESLEKYHYDPSKPEDTDPVKDGNDHAVDALRYLVLSIDKPITTAQGNYVGAA